MVDDVLPLQERDKLFVFSDGKEFSAQHKTERRQKLIAGPYVLIGYEFLSYLSSFLGRAGQTTE